MGKTSSIRKVVFLGDYLPRKCGIATFTSDLRCAVATEFPAMQCLVVPVNDQALHSRKLRRCNAWACPATLRVAVVRIRGRVGHRPGGRLCSPPGGAFQTPEPGLAHRGVVDRHD